MGHGSAPPSHPVVSPATLVLSHHMPVTVGFLPQLEYVSHFFLRACILALLLTWIEFLMVGCFFAQVSSWLTGVGWGYVTAFKAWTVRSKMCYSVAKVVNGPPPFARPYVKMVASLFGGPFTSWSMRNYEKQSPLKAQVECLTWMKICFDCIKSPRFHG